MDFLLENNLVKSPKRPTTKQFPDVEDHVILMSKLKWPLRRLEASDAVVD